MVSGVDSPLTASESPYLRSLFAFHAHHLETSPVLAHWEAGGIATVMGCCLAAVRGMFVATTQPAGHRLTAFLSVSRAAAPLYIIPFVLGSQLDCYEASWSRDKRKGPETWSGGGVTDLG